jgi:23S rRNA (cytidine1920-2'-O)/16S rRNA (cytidine1409-2'-O)-methyltransferase
MAARVRLDALIVQRGLAESREKARAFVLAGLVEVNGRPAHKAGTMVTDDVELKVSGPDHPWVGRGGIKLAHALEVFQIDPTGCLALDIGASTGGFSDVLLQRGARHVIALDVGHSQLHWKLRSDARVSVIEGVNARQLSRADLPDIGSGIDIVTIDVSFISLRYILPAVPGLLAPGAHIVTLIKPQFEAGRAEVGAKGLVTDPVVHARVVEDVTAAAAALGLARMNLIESPITGAEGNHEFLAHFRREA